ncbi:adenylate kinase family enzyme [Diaminobutyricimonas aerilata]|uniref:Adenylate kinase family enzyme n=1 Tax=Diaminobutyricimonas aerilata TaxID=1162967 RepID=A0A2M9CJH4_9MICO|nr:AAA family ATPase [Diaminobutyricimonas aerilata]PJJ72042.1 adenylate kinase family enzyme [Diaminobutyricimonas aerilata]
MLLAGDPLPHRPRRILVAGVSGSGKTTLARRLSAVTGIPHTELDALHHGPQWTPRPEFLDDVRHLAARDEWITEWQYTSARPLLAARADTLVWLDLPFPLTLARVVRRTLRRARTREVLWNGNVEPPLHTIFTDRENVVRWAISTRNKYKEQVPEAAAAHPSLTVVRLSSRADVERWMDGPVADLRRGTDDDGS